MLAHFATRIRWDFQQEDPSSSYDFLERGRRTESSDLLAVLDELDTDTLADSLWSLMLVLFSCRMWCFRYRENRVASSSSKSGSGCTYGVRLLGLNADLLEHNALGVGRTTEGAVIIVMLASCPPSSFVSLRVFARPSAISPSFPSLFLHFAIIARCRFHRHIHLHRNRHRRD